MTYSSMARRLMVRVLTRTINLRQREERQLEDEVGINQHTTI